MTGEREDARHQDVLAVGSVCMHLHSLLTSVLDGGEWLIVSPQYLLNRLGVPQSCSVRFGQQDNLSSLLAIKPGPLVTQHTAPSLH